MGGPLVLLSSTAVLVGVHEQVSGTAGLFAFAVCVRETSRARCLVAEGFRTSPAVSHSPADEQPVPASV